MTLEGGKDVATWAIRKSAGRAKNMLLEKGVCRTELNTGINLSTGGKVVDGN